MAKLNDNPSFCFIAPTDYLDFVYNEVQKHTQKRQTHLVLAHLIINGDQKYIDFYRARSEAGDLVICDNSAFELGGSVQPDQLIKAAQQVKAHSLVLPDYPGQDWHVTVDAAEQWVDKFVDAGLKPFFVPQSNKGDLEGWIQAYQYAATNEKIEVCGYSVLGIPNALPHVPRAYARVVMVEILKSRGVWTDRLHNHFLGCNAAPNVETVPLLLSGVLDSMDSSNPVWSGINGWAYDVDMVDYAPKRKAFLPHVDFGMKMNVANSFIDFLIAHNIAVTQDIFANPSKHLF